MTHTEMDYREFAEAFYHVFRLTETAFTVGCPLCGVTLSRQNYYRVGFLGFPHEKTCAWAAYRGLKQEEDKA